MGNRLPIDLDEETDGARRPVVRRRDPLDPRLAGGQGRGVAAQACRGLRRARSMGPSETVRYGALLWTGVAANLSLQVVTEVYHIPRGIRTPRSKVFTTTAGRLLVDWGWVYSGPSRSGVSRSGRFSFKAARILACSGVGRATRRRINWRPSVVSRRMSPICT